MAATRIKNVTATHQAWYVNLGSGTQTSGERISHVPPLIAPEGRVFTPTIQAFSLTESKQILMIFEPIFKQSNDDLASLKKALIDLQYVRVEPPLLPDTFYPVFSGFIPEHGERRCIVYRRYEDVKGLFSSERPRRWKRCNTLAGSVLFLLSEYMERSATGKGTQNSDVTSTDGHLTPTVLKYKADSVSPSDEKPLPILQLRRAPHCRTCHSPMKGHKKVCPLMSTIVQATGAMTLSESNIDSLPVITNSLSDKPELPRFQGAISDISLSNADEVYFFDVQEEQIFPLRRLAFRHGLHAIIFDKIRDDDSRHDLITLIVSKSKEAIKGVYHELW
ncbi:hypothetical protein BDZ97DRAFT_1926692 [Flammula alnicola]|nr:hypothetical protein BDZ97DRAFT_1926692 [Flammula alnicola]